MNSVRNGAAVATAAIAVAKLKAQEAPSKWEQEHLARVERLGSATRAALAEVVAMELEEQFAHRAGRTFVLETDIEEWCLQVGVDKSDRRQALDDLHREGWFEVGSCDCGITIERPSLDLRRSGNSR
jgi:hypothetical protein